MPQNNTLRFRIVCPHCEVRYPAADRSMAGKTIRCKHCGNDFTAAVMPAGSGTLGSGHTTTSIPAIKSATATSPNPPASPKTWWITVDGQKDGPHGLDDLREAAEVGAITAETLVWRTGQAEWTRAGDVPEVAVVLPNGDEEEPPPPPKGFSLMGMIFGICGLLLALLALVLALPAIAIAF